MALPDLPLSGLTLRGTPDRANDYIYVVNGSTQYKSTINNELGITGTPVGTTDSQTLTNKTLTAPTITSPVLSGTVTGTYTLGGAPTFPSSIVTLTGSQTLTNKILTSPTISSPTITNASITADSISGFTVANTGTIFGMSITNSAIPNSALPPGTVVQTVSANFSAVATGTTIIPTDDTIPQITEGTEFMTLAITPKATTNLLIISAVFFGGYSVIDRIQIALFQDATANALAGAGMFASTANTEMSIPLTHRMVAGTTSSTTFRIRAGGNGAGTLTFNGTAGSRRFGGITLSNITITEYKV